MSVPVVPNKSVTPACLCAPVFYAVAEELFGDRWCWFRRPPSCDSFAQARCVKLPAPHFFTLVALGPAPLHSPSTTPQADAPLVLPFLSITPGCAVTVFDQPAAKARVHPSARFVGGSVVDKVCSVPLSSDCLVPPCLPVRCFSLCPSTGLRSPCTLVRSCVYAL